MEIGLGHAFNRWRRAKRRSIRPEPYGFLTYTLEGRMSAMISHSGRKPLSVGDLSQAAVEEKAEAFSTFFGLRRAVHTGSGYLRAGRKVAPRSLGGQWQANAAYQPVISVSGEAVFEGSELPTKRPSGATSYCQFAMRSAAIRVSNRTRGAPTVPVFGSKLSAINFLSD
jgi:Lipocalin-like domain